MLYLKKRKPIIVKLINIFIFINILPPLIFIWLMLFGLDGITEKQWFAAWMTLGIAVLGLWIRYEVMNHRSN